MSKQTKSTYKIPIRMLQHPAIPLRSRILLAYSTFLANGQESSWASSRHIAFMVGLVGPDGEPTEQQYRAIRNARAALMRGNGNSPKSLGWERKTGRGERSRDEYKVIAPAMNAHSMAYLNEGRNNWLYTDDMCSPVPESTEAAETYDDEDVLTF